VDLDLAALVTIEETRMGEFLTQLLEPPEAASILGVRTRTLSAWRCQGIGPRYLRIHRRLVRYKREDLENWVEANMQEPLGASS
jgi:predicted DNA-binding transcriptional regulator AlpA